MAYKMQTDRKDSFCLQNLQDLQISLSRNNVRAQNFRERALRRVDKGHLHSKEGLPEETQGIGVLGKKEDKRSDR